MTENSVWKKAQTVSLQVADHIKPELDIGFDKQVPENVRNELRAFVEWMESNYTIPITLWVDFEYKHYLIRRDGKRVGYLFYWSDFHTYPVFDNEEDVPILRLPVRTEHSTIEGILGSFIEGLLNYYAWICNEIDGYKTNICDADEILQEYLRFRNPSRI